MKTEYRLFDILNEKYNSIFNKSYPGDRETIRRIARGEVRPDPRKTWNELLRSLGIGTTEHKVFMEGYISVSDPGQSGFVLIPEELAEKILVLRELP